MNKTDVDKYIRDTRLLEIFDTLHLDVTEEEYELLRNSVALHDIGSHSKFSMTGNYRIDGYIAVKSGSLQFSCYPYLILLQGNHVMDCSIDYKSLVNDIYLSLNERELYLLSVFNHCVLALEHRLVI